MTGEGPTRVRATELFDREFLGRLLRVLQQVQRIEQEGRQQSPPDGAKGFWARPGFSFSIPSVRLLRELLLGISAIYFAESVVYLLSGGPYVVPISTLIGCLTFHSGYWTLRERRFPGWLGVPLALLSLLIAGLALLFNHGLILPYFHAVFVLPLVFVYLCGQVASIVLTISFLLFFLVVLFSPFPGMEGQLSMPVMERVLILLVFQLSTLCSWLYNRWMQRVFSNYQGQMGTITSLLGLQGEAVEVLSAALRTEQGNMRAVLGLAHERPITPQRLAEIVDTIERLGGDLRRVVDSMDCLRILTQAQDSVEASSWALGTAEDMDEQFDLKTLVVSRLKSNLLLRNARILVDYAFDPAIPLRLAGDAVALRGAIDLITQGMLRDYLRPSSLLFVHSQLLGGEQGDRVQVLLRFRCVESYRIGGGQTQGVYGRERVDYSSLPPLGEPRHELQEGGCQVLYRFICKPVRSMQLPVVHLHTPDFADRSLLNSQQVLAQRLRGLRGLLVEDNPLNKRVLQLTLVDRVRELIAVESVAEAQERFSPGRYDFIIVDVRSLGERGVDLAQSVRRQERAAEEASGQPVSLLALTAFPTDAERARCLNAGFNHYLAKPFSNEQLYRAIVGGR